MSDTTWHWHQLSRSSPFYLFSINLSLSPWTCCATVCRAVASNSRDLFFRLSHWQLFLTVNWNEKTKRKEEEAKNGPLWVHVEQFDQDMLAPDFSGEAGWSLALGLVTSFCRRKTACWRPACCWLGLRVL